MSAKQQTTQQTGPNFRRLAAAAMVAGGLMLGHGLVYLAIADYLARPVTASPFTSEALDGFPKTIDHWTGHDVPLDPAIAVATDTDARINRVYSRNEGVDSLWLYAACGVKVRDLAPHRPEVCYTGNGWTLVHRKSMGLPLGDGRELTCKLFRFSRGDVGAQQIVVLYYYIVDGRYCAEISELRYNFWRIGYVAQIQIGMSLSENLTAEMASDLVCDFAVASAPRLAGLFGHAGKDPCVDSPGGPQKVE